MSKNDVVKVIGIFPPIVRTIEQTSRQAAHIRTPVRWFVRPEKALALS